MFENPLKLRVERARPRPSQRNERIYIEVRVHGQPQAEVAQRYALTPGRVSAICRQVENWRLWVNSQPRDEARELQEWRLRLLRIRDGFEHACLMAVHAHLNQRRELVTVHTSNRSGQTVTKRTVRKVRPSAQWLKIAENAVRKIDEIDERLGPAVAPSRIGEKLDALLSEFLASQAAETDQTASEESPTTASDEGRQAAGEGRSETGPRV